ncbi:MAG: DUF1565 domain-containing protein [Candidatus Sumerlaeota bacterium]|nr:DUF1565 domain-containing protein [Candidatus Sumerlaeota bacterium]
MNRKPVLIAILAVVAAMQIAGAQAQQPLLITSLQEAINAAKPGDVVRVPAGTYRGPIALKADVYVVGDGAEATILDGGGADNVVLGANDAVIAGVTIRNGKIGVNNLTRFVGVFDCKIIDCSLAGVWLENGCAAIVNNYIYGNQREVGISCHASNPYIVGNTIANHLMGVRAFNYYDPFMGKNYVAGNVIGLYTAIGTTVTLEQNTFFQNSQSNVTGQEMTAGNIIATAPAVQQNAYGTPDVDLYRKMMDVVFAEKISKHPLVIYTLEDQPGLFSVTTLFPWATFYVSSCNSETLIRSFEAFDLVEPKVLNSEYTTIQSLPTVAVKNDDIKDTQLDRFVMDSIYFHLQSYLKTDSGNLLFKRVTSFSNIEIIVPKGFIPVSVNYPALFVWREDKVVIQIVDVGRTYLDIVMSPLEAGPQDVYGVLKSKPAK